MRTGFENKSTDELLFARDNQLRQLERVGQRLLRGEDITQVTRSSTDVERGGHALILLVNVNNELVGRGFRTVFN